MFLAIPIGSLSFLGVVLKFLLIILVHLVFYFQFLVLFRFNVEWHSILSLVHLLEGCVLQWWFLKFLHLFLIVCPCFKLLIVVFLHIYCCVHILKSVYALSLIGSDHHDISQIKQHIYHHFQTKDLGKLIYLLRIKVAQSNNGIVISQWKYTLDILEEIRLMN